MASSDGGRTVIIVCYILHLVGAITGFFSIIGLIVNYVKLSDDGEMADSHHRWMIKSFWYAILGCMVCVALVFTIIGIPLAWLGGIAIWIWYVYRHVKGLIDLADNKSMSATALL